MVAFLHAATPGTLVHVPLVLFVAVFTLPVQHALHAVAVGVGTTHVQAVAGLAALQADVEALPATLTADELVEASVVLASLFAVVVVGVEPLGQGKLLLYCVIFTFQHCSTLYQIF